MADCKIHTLVHVKKFSDFIIKLPTKCRSCTIHKYIYTIATFSFLSSPQQYSSSDTTHDVSTPVVMWCWCSWHKDVMLNTWPSSKRSQEIAGSVLFYSPFTFLLHLHLLMVTGVQSTWSALDSMYLVRFECWKKTWLELENYSTIQCSCHRHLTIFNPTMSDVWTNILISQFLVIHIHIKAFYTL